MLGEYLISSQEMAAEIRRAAETDDAAKVGLCAHKLKASARAVGALALGDACAALEVSSSAAGADLVARFSDVFEKAALTIGDRLATVRTAQPARALE